MSKELTNTMILKGIYAKKERRKAEIRSEAR